jgi:hypothetical protein
MHQISKNDEPETSLFRESKFEVIDGMDGPQQMAYSLLNTNNSTMKIL